MPTPRSQHADEDGLRVRAGQRSRPPGCRPSAAAGCSGRRSSPARRPRRRGSPGRRTPAAGCWAAQGAARRRSSAGQLTRPPAAAPRRDRRGRSAPASRRPVRRRTRPSRRSTSRASSSARWVSTRAASRRLGSSSDSHRSASVLAYPLMTVTGVRSSCPVTARNSVRSSASGGSAVGGVSSSVAQVRDRAGDDPQHRHRSRRTTPPCRLGEVQVDRPEDARRRRDRMPGEAADVPTEQRLGDLNRQHVDPPRPRPRRLGGSTNSGAIGWPSAQAMTPAAATTRPPVSPYSV